MKTVDITWQPAEERFLAAGSHGQQCLVNAPHADAEARWTGFSPAELLLAAAGTCAGWDIVDILRKQRQAVEGISIRVAGTQDEAPPWAYREVVLHVTIRGHDIDRALAERAVRLSEEKYCSVTATVRGVARVGFELSVVETAATAVEPGR
ncbi:MAG TPA: OsmC family protein [Candidatus Limnocylindrales bacterium]